MSIQSNGNALNSNSLDVMIVGAGFAGLYLIHELRSRGFNVRAFEAGDGVGGTWYWNRYPGARCDVESLQYSYSFSDRIQEEWQWTERYANQNEILSYLNYVADTLTLRSHVQLGTEIKAATFDENERRWTITTDGGETWNARFLVLACGTLTSVRLPDIPGLKDFRGSTLHTARWPSENIDFSGKRVGIIGTGSTAIQVIPEVAAAASLLTVFQRTPNFVVPSGAQYLDPDELAHWKAHYPKIRDESRWTRGGVYDPNRNDQSALQVGKRERDERYSAAWAKGGVLFQFTFNDIQIDNEANKTAADFVRSQIRSIVHNPATADDLSPTDHPLSAKRLCVHSDYYATFNRPNVKLVNLRRNPIQRFTSSGAKCESLDEIPLDILILATGFDAMTGSLKAIDIRGRNDAALTEAWNAGPVTYLGLQVHGFPNMFLVTGPGSPSVLSNAVVSIEQHVGWIAKCLEDLRTAGKSMIEANLDAQRDWVDHVNAVADTTLFPHANSWYNGSNVPGKPRVFMPYVGGVGSYRKRCEEVAERDYEGFTLD
ncbi:flavin-containing monooxygenase [Tardiphaga sp. 215_C5_N2_1]|uniref:flavin-containing monooxygenase n=1 Tax=Tardiphaga sp. 215_C5_N2_1 TaxID=3240774 RepID=UPI003F8C3816